MARIRAFQPSSSSVVLLSHAFLLNWDIRLTRRPVLLFSTMVPAVLGDLTRLNLPLCSIMLTTSTRSNLFHCHGPPAAAVQDGSLQSAYANLPTGMPLLLPSRQVSCQSWRQAPGTTEPHHTSGVNLVATIPLVNPLPTRQVAKQRHGGHQPEVSYQVGSPLLLVS